MAIPIALPFTDRAVVAALRIHAKPLTGAARDYDALLDEVEPVTILRDHQRIRRLVDDGVDATAAIGATDIVLTQRQPIVSVHLA